MTGDKTAIETVEFQPGLGRQLWPNAHYRDYSPHPFCDFLFEREGEEGFIRVKVIKRMGEGTTVFITDGKSKDEESPDHQMNRIERIVYHTTSGDIDFRKEGVTLRIFKSGRYAFWA